MTKVFPEAVHGYFLLKIAYFGSGTKKSPSFISYKVPPLLLPTTKYHGIYAILGKCMTRFPIRHILANVLRPFAFQFALESPKSPNSNYFKHTIKSPRFCAHTDFKENVNLKAPIQLPKVGRNFFFKFFKLKNTRNL